MVLLIKRVRLTETETETAVFADTENQTEVGFFRSVFSISEKFTFFAHF